MGSTSTKGFSRRGSGSRNNVLVIAGHDPTGGAGVVADAQTISALGAHPVTLISAHTIQDTQGVNSYQPVPPELVVQQLETLKADMEFAAVKLGMLANKSLVEAIVPVIQSLNTPIVFDPVLASGAGDSLSDDGLVEVLCKVLLPQVKIVTPNLPELFCLTHMKAQEDDAAEKTPDQQKAAVRKLLEGGVEHVLLTGGHAKSKDVVNRLYPADKGYAWPRLEGEYHGSGCTLASAIAALLANGVSIEYAVEEAQEFTWQSLVGAYRISSGQSIPLRIRR
ncbi:MAG: hydroxymethylpyrimidine/phosphomethylpyrimidine kinase [Proteobacteria bacterium]|jgi:hydroxymethylpyrimidine/phosphomethylpyrimidine kinase|nr:hydroxymethylpyrimidine/phosphomethylpyrimidine kinase [Pseudomonadota bacterium]